MNAAPGKKPVDLVLSGGGVKGIGLVGAVVALMDAGYQFHRVSGTSAGSVVGAIAAAASMGDYFETVLTEPTPRRRRPAAAAARPSARCWPRFSLSCHL